MKLTLKTKTTLGKLSFVLIIAMFLLFYIGMSFVDFYESKSVQAGRTIPQDIIIRPGIAFPMLAGFLSGITAFFAGIINIIRKKEHSILVFLSSIIGFLVLLWCLAQFLFPY
jgi:hypothetical protein